MKTLEKIMLIIAGAGLIFACNKDEPVVTPGADIQSDKLVCGKVFKVEPAKGTDITTSLKQAFDDAIAAGPGSVVELPEGEFDLGFIEIREFNGSFMGAGKGRTVITAKTGLDCAGFESQGLWTFLINFVGGDILMSNMTIKIPGDAICADGSGFGGLVIFADYNNIYTSTTNSIKAIVDNVEFMGGNLNNCWNALAGGQNTKVTSGLDRSNIDMMITNCSFETFGFGTQIIGAKKGKYTLGTKNNGNTYSNCEEAAFIYDIINMTVEVTDNKFNVPGGYAFGLDFSNFADSRFSDEQQTSPTVVNIEGNEFIETGCLLGLLIRDNHRMVYPNELPMVVRVKNNKFNLSNSAIAGIGCFNMNAMVISNNRFTGSGQFGVRVMTGGTLFNVNGLMMGNNFSDLTCSAVTVFLNTGSSNWTIVGGNLGERILDLGNNNIITGFNVIDSEDPFGQTIVDNLEEIREGMDGLYGQ